MKNIQKLIFSFVLMLVTLPVFPMAELVCVGAYILLPTAGALTVADSRLNNAITKMYSQMLTKKAPDAHDRKLLSEIEKLKQKRLNNGATISSYAWSGVGAATLGLCPGLMQFCGLVCLAVAANVGETCYDLSILSGLYENIKEQSFLPQDSTDKRYEIYDTDIYNSPEDLANLQCLYQQWSTPIMRKNRKEFWDGWKQIRPNNMNVKGKSVTPKSNNEQVVIIGISY